MRQLATGRRRRLLSALVAVLLVALPGVASAHTGPTATSPAPFDGQAAITQLNSAAIVRLPGSPAVFDEARISTLMRGTSIKILLTPFEGVAEAARDAYDNQVTVVSHWADDHSVQLVLVTGLEIHLESEGVVQTPSDLGELRPTLQNSNLTNQLLFSLGELTKHDPGGPVATEPVAVTISPAPAAAQDVAIRAEQLASAGTVVDAGVTLSGDPQVSWHNKIHDQSLKLVIEPPLVGGPPVNLAAPLARRFPSDVVVVMQGRWIDIAGPDQALLDSAVLYAYGAGLSAFVAWGATPDQLLNLVINRIALLRTGSATGQPSPVTPDPVKTVRGWLVWIFVATALSIAVAAVLVSRRRRAKTRTSELALFRNRDRIAARLPGIAAGVLALDGLAGSGKPRELLDLATERYDVARSIIGKRGNGRVAADAADAAEAALRTAGELLHVPLPAVPVADGSSRQ